MKKSKQIIKLQALQEEARTLHQMTSKDASDLFKSMNRKIELIFGVGSKYIERFSELKCPSIGLLSLYSIEEKEKEYMLKEYSNKVEMLLGVFINEIQEF